MMAKRDDAETVGMSATIDEALEKTHFGRFNVKIILFSGLVLNNVVLESLGISFTLPIVACDLDLSYQQQGLLGAVCFLGIIVSSHFWGLLADTRGRKSIMRPALLLGFVITVISSFSLSFDMMIVLRFLSGILSSAGSATIYAYMGEFHSLEQRNRAILYAALMSAFSTIFFPLIAWLFINQGWAFNIPGLGIVFKPWRLFLIICGIPGFCCGLYMHFLPESPKYLLGMNKPEKALEVVRQIHRENVEGHRQFAKEVFPITSLLPDLDTPIRKLQPEGDHKSPFSLFKVIWDQTAPLFMHQHIRKTLLAALIQFITFFTAHGVYMWFPHILNSVMLYTANNEEPRCLCDILQFTQSSDFALFTQDTKEKLCVTQLEISTYKHTIVLEILYVALILLVIYVNKKFDRRPILIIILTICGLCGIVSLVIDIPLLAIYLFMIPLCCGLATSVLNTIVVDIYPTNLRAMAVCISLMLGRIGSVTGSNVLGALLETNCNAALFSASIALVIAAGLGFIMPRPQSGNNKKPDIVEDGGL